MAKNIPRYFQLALWLSEQNSYMSARDVSNALNILVEIVKRDFNYIRKRDSFFKVSEIVKEVDGMSTIFIKVLSVGNSVNVAKSKKASKHKVSYWQSLTQKNWNDFSID